MAVALRIRIRWRCTYRQQRKRARDETRRTQPQELALRGQRARWKNGCNPSRSALAHYLSAIVNARGGRTAAILASLTSTCRRHDIDPQLYLTQLLMNLPTVQISQLPAWLPDQWKLQQHTPLSSI